MEINKQMYLKWANSFEVEYASTSIPTGRGSTVKRLRFNASLNGEYKVTSGSDRLYKGSDFDKAAETYNKALP